MEGAGRASYSRDVYRTLIRRRVVSNFARLSAGDYKAVVAQLAPDVHHVFAGDTALGGERHSHDAVERWFERLYRLCPQIRFEVGRVISSGPPWDISVAAEWVAHVTPAAGEPYVNTGTHVFRIRNGRVAYIHAYIHAYEDSEKVARACEQMAASGIDEAAAPPIIE
jgi:ketosteroid isomerase-like protein